MLFYSLNNADETADFREATIKGQTQSKGLYFPSSIPVFPEHLIKSAARMSKEEIAFQVIRPYVGASIPEQILTHIVEETVNFEIPLVSVTENISSLELFHGPTLAFKDIGARFMSRCLWYFMKDRVGKVTVLVATSGDTGGAVASGFYGVDGVEVIILYPSGKVSNIQELQLTTLGSNITAIEINGRFDDCQQLVKRAFADADLQKKYFLTSANSINVARWLPQQFYYLFAWQQWPEKDNPPVIAVPSGNFGNICAGLLAYRSGLPVNHFIAACNANDVIPAFLQSGNYEPKQAVATLSNAMDVGDPSNFVRILQLFDKDLLSLRKILSAVSISDQETNETMKRVFTEHRYMLDPHGAVGMFALERYLAQHRHSKGFFLETAHPVKFSDTVKNATGTEVDLPQNVSHLLGRQKSSVRMDPGFDEFKSYLMARS